MLGFAPLSASPITGRPLQPTNTTSMNYVMDGQSASYSVAATKAILAYGLIMYTTGAGVVVINPQPFQGAKGYGIGGAPGAFTVTGNLATLQIVRGITGKPGGFLTGGFSATMAPAYIMNATPGSYAVTSAISAQAKRTLYGVPGVFNVRGVAARLGAQLVILGTPAGFTVTGNPSIFSAGFLLVTRPGAVSVKGSPAGLKVAHVLPGVGGSSTVTAGPANGHVVRQIMGRFAQVFVSTEPFGAQLARGGMLPALTFNVTGTKASPRLRRQVLGTPAATQLGQPAMSASLNRAVRGTPAAIGAGGRSAQLHVSRGFTQASAGAVTVTGHQATLTVHRTLLSSAMRVELLVLSARLTYSGNPTNDKDTTYNVAADMQPRVQSTGTVNASDISVGG